MRGVVLALGAFVATLALAFSATGDASSTQHFGKAVQVSAKSADTCALTEHGTVACWGIHGLGSIPPTGSPEPSYKPVLVQGATHATQIVVGAGAFGHGCFVTTAGAVKCWGRDNEISGYTDPEVVPGLEHGIAAVVTGNHHACALSDQGGVKCWGYNGEGQLGIGTYGGAYGTPQPVLGLNSGVRALGAGDEHTCALLDSGQLKCWGDNFTGQLGDGTTTSRAAPVGVEGVDSTVTQIAAGGGHTCALLSTREIECWGANYFGQLGDGTTVSHLTAAPVTDLPPADSVASGGDHTCAISEESLYCWGGNSSGQLGDGTTTDRHTPTGVEELGGTPSGVSAGNLHTCAALLSGALYCWGENGDGELGIGNTSLHRVPVAVRGLHGRVARIAAGGYKTCGLLKRGRVECWGPKPSFVKGLGAPNRAIASGGFFECAVTHGRTVKCWGDNEAGQLGDGTTTSRDNAEPVVGISDPVLQVAPGYAHACALTVRRHVLCWGSNRFGQLGDGTRTDRHTPVPVQGLPPVRSLTAGGEFTCAVTVRRHLKCWGKNDSGQLGRNSRETCPVGSGEYEVDYPCALHPIGVAGLGGGIATATAGFAQICVSARAHRALCWGNDEFGQLGYEASQTCEINTKEDDPCSHTPTRVAGLGHHVRALSAGWLHTCALLLKGRARCWGYNGEGELGNGESGWGSWGPDLVAPRLSERIRQLSAGGVHTCALLRSRRVKCWGANRAGQLGTGASGQMLTPQKVLGFG